MLQEIFEAIRPQLLEMIMSLVFLLLTAVASRVYRATGVMIEEKHLRTLQSAIRTGTLAAMDRGLSKEVLTETVVAYVRASVPDAIKALKPSDAVLSTLIASKLTEAAKK